jgi:hypothetical protein
MNRWILDRLAHRRSEKPDVPLRISNLTRQTELAHCVDVVLMRAILHGRSRERNEV